MIRVILQNENGIEVGSPVDFPTKVISCVDDDRFKCLRFVDPYGDTVFNCFQMAPLSEDLDLLENSMTNLVDKDALCALRQLIVRCSEGPHLYIKCIGD